MKPIVRLSLPGVVVVGILSTASLAHAQPRYDVPGSVLIFPFFQQDRTHDTFLTITNTSLDRTPCGNTFRAGDVQIIVNFIDPADCTETNVPFFLTVGDTITLLASQQSLSQSEGWAWLDARDPESGDPIAFNHLVGSAMVFEVRTQQTWEYNAFPFRGLPGAFGGVGMDACGRDKVDFAGQPADFDGMEYDFWPDILYLDNFFEESATFDDELVLIAPDQPNDVRLRGINFGFWNNSETRFSRSDGIFCFLHSRLGAISLIVKRLGGADRDTTDAMGHFFQTGWMEVDSAVPLLGVFVSKKTGTRFAGGRELQFAGAEGDEPGETPAVLQRAD